MSIPPLVCSTPPPPDQCEDDKEPEDFDIQYNLSQEDDYDTNEYDYGNFSTFNNFKTIPDLNDSKKLELPVISSDEIKVHSESTTTNEQNSYFDTTQVINNNTRIEDNVIEDLDLKLDRVSINSGKITQTEDDTDLQDSSRNISQSLGTDDQDNVILQHSEISEEKKTDDNTFQSFCKNVSQEQVVLENNDLSDKLEPLENVVDQHLFQEQGDESIEAEDVEFQFKTETSEEVNTPSTAHDSENVIQNEDDDDFGEFDDFKSVSNEVTTTTVVDNWDNPWGEQSSSNFKANFDNFQTKSDVANIQNTNENVDIENTEANDDDDDDFGDFDDYKSSTEESKVNYDNHVSNEHSIFNIQSTEHHNQLVEKSLSSIFEHDISDTETQFEGRLESLLSETWRQLTNVEVRLPYMINWNNSLGQKTLLKALCIDSRNILFGPKWASNMPKYAANLTAAPLQPQKPSTTGESLNTDKPSGKAADTWVDPFTSDGRESCNVENSKAAAAAPPQPTNLEVFKSSSTNAGKIYSSTLNVQPLRQINLPDTHIFTPTDSEIPRSKTIRNDNGNSVLVPQPASTSNDPDDEYSDFQDFKGTTDTAPSGTETVTEQSKVEGPSDITTLKDTSITYQTSILQPIKLEPLTPTLNWPDPGEIKTTFEDFSDFVSNTPWPSENHTPNAVRGDRKLDLDPVNTTSSYTTPAAEMLPVSKSDTNDDDFATFQSADPPVQSGSLDFVETSLPKKDLTRIKTSTINESTPSTAQKKSDLDIVFPNWDKSNTLSNISLDQQQVVQNVKTPNIPALIPNSVQGSKETSQSFKSSPTHPGSTPAIQVLRPTPATSATIQKQTTAQILQPLSLEGYSQINWPNPGSIDLQDLSRFNPVETLPSLKGEVNGSHSKNASPAHSQRSKTSDDDWGDFVSSKPKQYPLPKMQPAFADDDEWTDFVSSPNVQSQNGLNTISLNVHANLNVQKSTNQNKYKLGSNQKPLDIPSLNYVTPKTNHHRACNDRHFQNL